MTNRVRWHQTGEEIGPDKPLFRFTIGRGDHGQYVGESSFNGIHPLIAVSMMLDTAAEILRTHYQGDSLSTLWLAHISQHAQADVPPEYQAGELPPGTVCDGCGQIHD